VLIGHSMGGAIALTIAVTRPDLPRALVMAASGARLRMQPDVIEAARVRAESTEPGVRIPRVIPIEAVLSPKATTEAVTWLRPRFGECTAQATYADFLATHNADVMTRLGEILQPTLVIGGEDDLWTPPKFQQYFAAHIANAQLVMLPDTGHYPFVERAEIFNQELERFLAEI